MLLSFVLWNMLDVYGGFYCSKSGFLILEKGFVLQACCVVNETDYAECNSRIASGHIVVLSLVKTVSIEIGLSGLKIKL